MAAEGEDVGVARNRAAVGRDAGDAVAVGEQAGDGHAIAEVDAARRGEIAQAHGELEAVAGLVFGEPQAADELLPHAGKRRLGADAALDVEDLVRDAEVAQHVRRPSPRPRAASRCGRAAACPGVRSS